MKDYLSDADKVYTETMRDSWLRYRIQMDAKHALRIREAMRAVIIGISGLVLLAVWASR